MEHVPFHLNQKIHGIDCVHASMPPPHKQGKTVSRPFLSTSIASVYTIPPSRQVPQSSSRPQKLKACPPPEPVQ